MKKNIIIGILSITTVISVLFGIYQQTVAKRLRIEAEHAAAEATKQTGIAEMNAMEAMRQKEVAMREHEALEVANQKLEMTLSQSKKAK